MRLLILLPFFTYGGAEKQATILACRLSELGHEVMACAFQTPRSEAPLKAELESKGIACYELPFIPNFDFTLSPERSIWTRLIEGLKRYEQIHRLTYFLPPGRFDVVVPFTSWSSLVAIWFREKLDASVVVWNHRGGYDAGGLNYSPELIQKVREVHPVFVANSKAGALFLNDKLAFGSSPIHLIRNFIEYDLTCFPDPENAFRVQNTRCQLLQVANFFPEKDFDTLIRAIRLLKAACVPCHLHLAGNFPDETQKHHFLRGLSEMGVSDIVTHHGELDQEGVIALLKKVDIGVLSSKSEGCPNSVMEYMYWGLPVIGSDIPGIRDLVGDEDSQWLFKVGDAEGMKGLVERLAGDHSLRANIGQGNQQRLSELFDVDAVMALWRNVLSL